MFDSSRRGDGDRCKNDFLSRFIPEEALGLIEQNKAEVDYFSGQVIIKQSSFASKILYLKSGYIKVIKEGNKGKNCFIKVIEEGNFIFVPIHENQQKYSFTAVALTDVQICEIQESIIHNALVNSSNLFDYLNNQYYVDQQFLMNKLLVLATRNSHGKLASGIIYLNQFNKPGFSIFDYITRKDLADFCSISLESVNKILQELNNDKIIFIDRKGIQINKLVLLEKLSNLG